MTDPIADMLTRIRNANQQRHDEVVVPASKLKVQLAEILKNEGFIKGYKVEGEGVIKNIVITLKYKGNDRVITGLKRVSKPGLRQYAKVNEIPKVLNGLGIALISTSPLFVRCQNITFFSSSSVTPSVFSHLEPL